MLPTRVSLRICMVRRRAARRAIGLLPTPSALLGAGSWRSVRRMGRPPASGGRGEIKSVGQRPQNLAMSVIAILRQLTWFQGWPPTRAAGGANDYKAASPIWRGVMWSSIAQALTRERLVKRRRWP